MITIPTLGARLKMVEYAVEQERLNTGDSFDETDFREELSLMESPELTRLVHALECNHF